MPNVNSLIGFVITLKVLSSFSPYFRGRWWNVGKFRRPFELLAQPARKFDKGIMDRLSSPSPRPSVPGLIHQLLIKTSKSTKISATPPNKSTIFFHSRPNALENDLSKQLKISCKIQNTCLSPKSFQLFANELQDSSIQHRIDPSICEFSIEKKETHTNSQSPAECERCETPMTVRRIQNTLEIRLLVKIEECVGQICKKVFRVIVDDPFVLGSPAGERNERGRGISLIRHFELKNLKVRSFFDFSFFVF